jgi:hypothetical protein
MKSAALAWLVLSVCAGAIVTISAQGDLQGMISSIPAWPADGKIPENIQNNYVFLGPRLGEIIVSYPASLDDPSQTGRRTFTFELRNQVSPTFTVQLAKDSNGLFSYDYTLRNGESAKQSIQSWFLVGPAQDASFVSTGAGWSASKALTARTRQTALPTVSQVGATVMFHAPAGQTMLPGDARGGFHLTSSYSPGFTTAYVKGDVGLIRFPDLPTVVGDQVGILQQPGWDSKVGVILGPRFPPEWSPQAIAADFHIGISKLVATGALQQNSPFVKAALDKLAGSIQAGGVPNVAEVVRLLPAPAAGLENEIAAAMRINGR